LIHKIDIYWSKIFRYIEDNSDEIPEEAGVYEILAKRNDGKYNRKYIGQTENLYARYLEHLLDNEENSDIHDGLRKKTCGFDYALIESKEDRLDAEQKLYDEYKYSWNKQRPKGSGRNLDIEVIEHNPGEE